MLLQSAVLMIVLDLWSREIYSMPMHRTAQSQLHNHEFNEGQRQRQHHHDVRRSASVATQQLYSIRRRHCGHLILPSCGGGGTSSDDDDDDDPLPLFVDRNDDNPRCSHHSRHRQGQDFHWIGTSSSSQLEGHCAGSVSYHFFSLPIHETKTMNDNCPPFFLSVNRSAWPWNRIGTMSC
jgi:hypothetical protein